ncbi:hypothetical protein O6H91_02G036100 [Diphasiastrum complanatum]|uniref:Uncharacterized protein n=2 Tax=Diphasiastrum complanatum TaxID=34168 RepID=A0ACC2EEC5_DIPCM|nr:hypothetical protein O6H91_02G036100 [Diphasiastrum complanatum]
MLFKKVWTSVCTNSLLNIDISVFKLNCFSPSCQEQVDGAKGDGGVGAQMSLRCTGKDSLRDEASPCGETSLVENLKTISRRNTILTVSIISVQHDNSCTSVRPPRTLQPV